MAWKYVAWKWGAEYPMFESVQRADPFPSGGTVNTLEAVYLHGALSLRERLE